MTEETENDFAPVLEDVVEEYLDLHGESDEAKANVLSALKAEVAKLEAAAAADSADDAAPAPTVSTSDDHCFTNAQAHLTEAE